MGLNKTYKQYVDAHMLLARQQVRVYHIFFFKRKKPFLKKNNSFSSPNLPHTHSSPTTTTPPQGPLPVKLNRPGPYPAFQGAPHYHMAQPWVWHEDWGVSILTVSIVAMGAWAGAAWKAMGKV